jgi:hypothetical protein
MIALLSTSSSERNIIPIRDIVAGLA